MNVVFISLFSGAALGESRLPPERTLAWVDSNKDALRVIPTRNPERLYNMTVADFCALLRTDDNKVRNLKRMWMAADRRIIVWSSPCIDLTVAGKRDSTWTHSGCWTEALGVVEELRPDFIVVENVLGSLYDHSIPESRRAYGKEVIHALTERNYEVAWRVLDEAAFGLPNRRPRVYFLAGRRGMVDVASVLLNPESHKPYLTRASSAAVDGDQMEAPASWRELATVYEDNDDALLVREGSEKRQVEVHPYLTGFTRSGSNLFLRVRTSGNCRGSRSKRRSWYKVTEEGIKALFGVQHVNLKLAAKDSQKYKRCQTLQLELLAQASGPSVMEWIAKRLERPCLREELNVRRLKLVTKVKMDVGPSLPEAGTASWKEEDLVVSKASMCSPYPVMRPRQSLIGVLLNSENSTLVTTNIALDRISKLERQFQEWKKRKTEGKVCDELVHDHDILEKMRKR